MSLLHLLTELKQAQWVNLSHRIDADIPMFSAFEAPSVETLFTVQEHGFYARRFAFATQTGTHIDAPGHFVAGSGMLESLDLKDLLLPLYVINREAAVQANADYELSVADIAAFEQEHGRIPAGSFVAFASGWSRRWPDKAAFANADEHGHAHVPGWSLDALKFLFEQRQIKAVGHETLDTDSAVAFRHNNALIGEYYVLEHGFQVEVLNKLYELPATGALISIAFPDFKDAPGFPVRAIAIVPQP